MPRAKTPRTPKPKTEKVAKRTVKNKEVIASGTGNGNGNGNYLLTNLESEIRVRAYELYEGRGYGDGLADEDWFQAEKEVLGRRP